MKSFKDYLNCRDCYAEQLGDAGPDDPMQDEETMDLLKIVYQRYKDDFQAFLEGLSGRQDDHDLKELLGKIGGHNKDIDIYGHKRKDKRPEVMPPIADQGVNDNDSD